MILGFIWPSGIGSESSRDMRVCRAQSGAAVTIRHRRKGRLPDDRRTPTSYHAAQPDDSPSFVIWLPVAEPRKLEHCVTHAQAASAARAFNGIYTSICGVRFAPVAPMTTPPWPHCPNCAQIHQRWVAAAQTARQGSHRYGMARRFLRGPRS